MPDMLTFDHDVAGRGDFGFQHRVLSQAAHQNARPAVDEPLGETFVQGVGQIVLYLTRDALPMLRIAQPVGTIGDEGPGSHLGDARRQRIDVAVGAIERRDWRANQSSGICRRARQSQRSSARDPHAPPATVLR